MAKTDLVPPKPPVCAAVLCPAVVPTCGCVNHKCATKVLCAQPFASDPAGKAAVPVAPPSDAGVACPAI
jgi:hypothetical protein